VELSVQKKSTESDSFPASAWRSIASDFEFCTTVIGVETRFIVLLRLLTAYAIRSPQSNPNEDTY
jgi:hypothetical protein